MKTFMPNEQNAQQERKWYVVDMKDQVLGRAAAHIASVLRGKNKPEFTPFIDCGDFVVVINVEHLKLTGRKLDRKLYRKHTGRPGGLRTRTARQMLETKPEDVLLLAIKGMLPKNSIGRQMIRKLKVYTGPEHPHQAQQPQNLEIKG
ncbi:50S ribosomal protein L13 [Myxococcota bacterium]|jgi:large subunit ribosomal protein L13|nr:50S ribosomal protein L13 [Myxococcota bacterium]